VVAPVVGIAATVDTAAVEMVLVVGSIAAADIADMGLVVVASCIPLFNVTQYTLNSMCICSTTQTIIVSNYKGTLIFHQTPLDSPATGDGTVCIRNSKITRWPGWSFLWGRLRRPWPGHR
jgi:hypothetical protein